MSNRAERRRVAREGNKKENYYYYSKSQIESMVKAASQEKIRAVETRVKQEATNTVMSLLLTLPMITLMDHYWHDPEEQQHLIPEFMDHLLELYESWVDGEVDLEDLKQEIVDKIGIELRPNVEVNE